MRLLIDDYMAILEFMRLKDEVILEDILIHLKDACQISRSTARARVLDLMRPFSTNDKDQYIYPMIIKRKVIVGYGKQKVYLRLHNEWKKMSTQKARNMFDIDIIPELTLC